jgi:hypothetical protein
MFLTNWARSGSPIKCGVDTIAAKTVEVDNHNTAIKIIFTGYFIVFFSSTVYSIAV